MKLLELATRVKAGATFLDNAIPKWRVILRRHAKDFNMADGDQCVLGTLEHYAGRLHVLRRQRAREILGLHSDNRFQVAAHLLGITGPHFSGEP